MLHYTDWPNDEKPTNKAALLALIKDALELQRNTGNRAMTVMCRYLPFFCVLLVWQYFMIPGLEFTLVGEYI